VNQWLNPLKRATGSNLVDVGRTAVRVDLIFQREATPKPNCVFGGEAIGEFLRCTRGEAAAEKLDAHPVDRFMVNVGTPLVSPSPPPSQGGDGQARRRLMIPEGDGGSVVVRGRESRSHGEGSQQVSSRSAGIPGER